MSTSRQPRCPVSVWFTLLGNAIFGLALGQTPAQAPLFPLTSPVLGPNGSLAGLWDAVSVGDFNNDGDPDIIAGLSPVIAWITGGSQGTFGSPNLLILAPQAIGTALSAGFDLNGDGYQDVVVSNSAFNLPASQIRVMIGNGLGTFTLSAPLPVPNGFPGHRAWADDVIAGGVAEIVVQSATAVPQNLVFTTWSYSPIQGTWSMLASTGSVFTGITAISSTLADMNGDGLRDIVGTLHNGFGSSTHVFVIPGIPAPPYFGTPVVVPRPAPTQFTWSTLLFTVGDVNGDGCDDVVAREGTPAGDFIATAFGNPQSTLGAWMVSMSVTPDVLGFPPLLLGDFDGDGFTDLIVSVNPTPNVFPLNPSLDLHFHRGDGTGLFNPAPLILANNPPGFGHYVVLDADQDGDQDIVGWSTATTSVAFNQSNLGQGSSAWNGIVPRLTSTLARPGNPAFQVALDSAPLLSPCLLAASLAQVLPVPATGIAIDLTPSSLLWPLGAVGPTTTDGFGRALFPIPLPNTPSLTGARVFVQWAVADPLSAAGFALSSGRQIILW